MHWVLPLRRPSLARHRKQHRERPAMHFALLRGCLPLHPYPQPRCWGDYHVPADSTAVATSFTSTFGGLGRCSGKRSMIESLISLKSWMSMERWVQARSLYKHVHGSFTSVRVFAPGLFYEPKQFAASVSLSDRKLRCLQFGSCRNVICLQISSTRNVSCLQF